MWSLNYLCIKVHRESVNVKAAYNSLCTSIYKWCTWIRLIWTKAGLISIQGKKAHLLSAVLSVCPCFHCAHIHLCFGALWVWNLLIHFTWRAAEWSNRGANTVSHGWPLGAGLGAHSTASPQAVLTVKSTGFHAPALKVLLPKRHHWARRLILAKISYLGGGKVWS